jgi:ADP-heptose:LPS heptosyltransferase
MVNCRVGLLAALISASDLYIGYDSAGQHIAAASGTPCIDIFAGYESPRIIDRWRPTGPGTPTVIDAGSGRPISEIIEEVKAAVMQAFEG